MDQEEQNPQTTNPTSKPSLGCTRNLDNHYDPRVHEKPWIAPGCLRDYKYEYSDSGLGFVMKKQEKLKGFKERHEQAKEIEELNKQSKGFRNFREYDDVSNNEILITIEYCTNCSQHQGSTRHNEEKYAYYANALKKEIMLQYPVVRVILKPLIFEDNEETETLYLRSRLGAFEVQLFSRDKEGKPTKKYIFSKLRTRAWPNISQVVENISGFLPTCDFVVHLIDENFDPEDVKEEDGDSQKNKSQTNKLKEVFVVLKPVRSLNKSPTEASTGSKGLGESNKFNMTGNSRPTSAALRPQSAYSSTSNKSMLSTKKSASGDNAKANNEGPRQFVEQSDNFGVVLFKQIPHNIYELEVVETRSYLTEKRVCICFYPNLSLKIVNIFEKLEKNDLKEEIILREQTMGSCLIKLFDNGAPFTGGFIIVAKKHPNPDSKTALLREKQPQGGEFHFMIDPGEYIISICRPGFPERRAEISVGLGSNELEFQVKQLPIASGTGEAGGVSRVGGAGAITYSSEKVRSPEHGSAVGKGQERPATGSRQRPPSSKGRTQDPLQAMAMNNLKGLEVIPQEKAENSPVQKSKGVTQEASKVDKAHEEEPKQKERVKSALVKKVELLILDIDSGKPVEGATVILEEIQFKGNTNEQGKCFVPVNKLNCGKLIIDHQNYFGMVEEYGGDSDLDFKTGAEKKFNLVPRPNDVNEVQIRFLPANNVNCAKVNVLYEGDEEKKDITVHHKEGGKEIIVLKNLLKKHGVFRIVVDVSNINEFLNPESMFIISRYDDCDRLFVFPPTEKMLKGQRLIWDAGFFADPAVNPQFVEINAYSNTEITLYTYLKEYQMLLNYLHHSKSDIKTLLGFKDKTKIEKDGDILVSKQVIYASLDKYGLEIKNLDHLLSSACTPEGLYSFQECERRFGTLRPPFNFVKDHKKDHAEADSGEGEDEYLFEDV